MSFPFMCLIGHSATPSLCRAVSPLLELDHTFSRFLRTHGGWWLYIPESGSLNSRRKAGWYPVGFLRNLSIHAPKAGTSGVAKNRLLGDAPPVATVTHISSASSFHSFIQLCVSSIHSHAAGNTSARVLWGFFRASWAQREHAPGYDPVAKHFGEGILDNIRNTRRQKVLRKGGGGAGGYFNGWTRL